MARRKRDPDTTPIPDRILQAATKLLSVEGYENTSMKSIAAEADITAGALYYHFANKQDIVFRVLEQAIGALTVACKAAVEIDRDDPVAALRDFVAAHVNHHLDQLHVIAPVYSALVYGARRRNDLLSEEQSMRLRELEREHFTTLHGIVIAGVKRGVLCSKDTKLDCFSIIGMCEHVVNWANPKGKLRPGQIADRVADQAVRMLSC